MSISRVAVVGAGIIGVALAREITRQLPDAEVTVFDRGPGIASAQSGHTAGIVHAGLDAEPGSLDATLARRGLELLIPYLVALLVGLHLTAKALREKDPRESAAAVAKLLHKLSPHNVLTLFPPVIDGDLLPENPVSRLAKGPGDSGPR